MKKTLLVLLTAMTFLVTPLSARKAYVTAFFAEEVPRYPGLAIGAHFLNQYAIGDWAQYASANVGGGIDLELTLPPLFPINFDMGLCASAEFAHVIPKTGSVLASDENLRFSGGLWFRIPLLLVGHPLAIQPQAGYMFDLHNVKGQNGTAAGGWYNGSAIWASLGLRYATYNSEFELAPLYCISPQQNGLAINNFGFRLGALWHISGSR